MLELAKRIDRAKSTVTTLVNKLVTSGYVVKQNDPNDHRITYISLTKKGKALKPEIEEISRRLLENTYKSLSDQEKEAVVHGLEKILKHW
jgi:DNA-binding MarR family transcriptional regulator